MQLSTYLKFNGDCREAFAFYEELLDGTITAMMTWGDGPACAEVPAESQDLIMHAGIDIAGHVLMGSDATPDRPYDGIRGANVVINTDDPDRADTVFDRLSEHGQVIMAMDETFFASRFGVTVDRFGVTWMIVCEKEN